MNQQSVADNVDDGVNKQSDSSGYQYINEDITVLLMTVQLPESAEVSMTKEDAVKEPKCFMSITVEVKMSQLMMMTAGGWSDDTRC